MEENDSNSSLKIYDLFDHIEIENCDSLTFKTSKYMNMKLAL